MTTFPGPISAGSIVVGFLGIFMISSFVGVTLMQAGCVATGPGPHVGGIVVTGGTVTGAVPIIAPTLFRTTASMSIASESPV